MNDDMRRLIELTRFRGSVLDPELSPEQIKWYNYMADWMEEQDFILAAVKPKCSMISGLFVFTGLDRRP